MKLRQDVMTKLRNFVVERQKIYLRKQQGEKKPWTKDKILQTYRFCNVYREQDKVTVWLRKNIREPYALNTRLWFMLCAARQINWPETLEELMHSGNHVWPAVGEWRWQNMRKAMLKRQNRGDKLYTGAYMINAQFGDDNASESDKAWFTCKLVLQPLWKKRDWYSSKFTEAGGTLADAYQALQLVRGWGPFLSAQVVADLKHTHYLKDAPDFWDWAVLGPGSRRGLNRLYVRDKKTTRPRPLNQQFEEKEAMELLRPIREDLSHALVSTGLGKKLCLQDTQNALCEYSKYARTLEGTGRPRSLYNGKKD